MFRTYICMEMHSVVFLPMRTKYLSACTELQSRVWCMPPYPSPYRGRTEIETSSCLETITSYWQSVDTVCCCYRAFSYSSFRHRSVETRQRSDEDRTSIQYKFLSMMKMMLFIYAGRDTQPVGSEDTLIVMASGRIQISQRPLNWLGLTQRDLPDVFLLPREDNPVASFPKCSSLNSTTESIHTWWQAGGTHCQTSYRLKTI